MNSPILTTLTLQRLGRQSAKLYSKAVVKRKDHNLKWGTTYTTNANSRLLIGTTSSCKGKGLVRKAVVAYYKMHHIRI